MEDVKSKLVKTKLQ